MKTWKQHIGIAAIILFAFTACEKKAQVAEIAELNEKLEAAQADLEAVRRGNATEAQIQEVVENADQKEDLQFFDDPVLEGNGIFVTKAFIVNDEDRTFSTRIAYSNDGKTWTAANTPFPKKVLYNINNIAYESNKFVASGYQQVGQDGDPKDFMMAYSEDGINWKASACPLPDNTMIDSITYSNGRFVIKGKRGGETAISTDGINWSVE